MKKILALALAAMLLLSLAACGGKSGTDTPAPAASAPATSAPVPAASAPAASAPAAPAASAPAPVASAPAASAPAAPAASAAAQPQSAVDGTLTVNAGSVAVVVNGTAVPMPYNLKALEAAGVPADEGRSEIELGAGDFFSANLYLDENEDYLLIPAYYNGGDAAVKLAEAEAEEITLTTYADEPKDQGVSVWGVSFGMPRSEVKALLGEPMSDDGDYCEWHVEVPDIAYEGTLSMYFTADADDAGVSQLDLTVFAK